MIYIEMYLGNLGIIFKIIKGVPFEKSGKSVRITKNPPPPPKGFSGFWRGGVS